MISRVLNPSEVHTQSLYDRFHLGNYNKLLPTNLGDDSLESQTGLLSQPSSNVTEVEKVEFPVFGF